MRVRWLVAKGKSLTRFLGARSSPRETALSHPGEEAVASRNTAEFPIEMCEFDSPWWGRAVSLSELANLEKRGEGVTAADSTPRLSALPSRVTLTLRV